LERRWLPNQASIALFSGLVVAFSSMELARIV
jgi:hypothetical protein